MVCLGCELLLRLFSFTLLLLFLYLSPKLRDVDRHLVLQAAEYHVSRTNLGKGEISMYDISHFLSAAKYNVVHT